MDGITMYEIVLFALLIWREDRGGDLASKYAVAWSVRNRVLHPSWWGADWVSVILKPFQYSCFNHDDPNAVLFPFPQDTSWQACLKIAQEVYAGQGMDPTGGSTHYFDRSLDNHPPKWSTDASMQHAMDAGRLHFFRKVA